MRCAHGVVAVHALQEHVRARHANTRATERSERQKLSAEDAHCDDYESRAVKFEFRTHPWRCKEKREKSGQLRSGRRWEVQGRRRKVRPDLYQSRTVEGGKRVAVMKPLDARDRTLVPFKADELLAC